MKNFKFLIILLLLSVNSFAQTSTGWQTIYESNIGKIDMMVTINDPNAKKHMWHSGVYFRTNIPYYVQITVYAKEIQQGFDNGKSRYNDHLQGTNFIKSTGWRESDVLVSDVRSFKGAYINYLEIDNQVLFRNGQEISQFYYNTNGSSNSSSTNQNGNNTSNNNYKDFTDLVAEHNRVCQELMNTANNAGKNSSMLTRYCQQGGNVNDSPSNRTRLKNEINEMNNEIHTLKYSNNSSSSGTSSTNRGGNVVTGNTTNTNSEGTGWNGNNSASNQQVDKTQKTIETTAKLVTTGIDLFNAIKEDRIERQKWEAEQKIKKENERKEREENAQNGDFYANYLLAQENIDSKEFNTAYKHYVKALLSEKYDGFRAKEKYYSEDNIQSSVKYKKEDLYKELVTSLMPLLGKDTDLWKSLNSDFEFNNNDNVIYYKNCLIINNSDMVSSISVTEEMRVNAFRSLQNAKDLLSKITVAYYQCTGEYEKYGILKNEKNALDFLLNCSEFDNLATKSEKKWKDLSKYKYGNAISLANYYLGLLYEKGIAVGNPDPKKAKKHFIMAFTEYGNMDKITSEKDIIDGYFPNLYYKFENVNQFNGIIRTSMHLIKKYSSSEDRKEKELAVKLANKLKNSFPLLLSNEDRKFLGLPERTNLFEFTEKYSFFSIKENTPITIKEIVNDNIAKNKITILYTFSFRWCQPCLKDIEELKEFDAKKYDITLINVDKKSYDYDVLSATIKYKPEYLEKFRVVYDKYNELSIFDGAAAPYFYVYDSKGNLVLNELGLNMIEEFKKVD